MKKLNNCKKNLAFFLEKEKTYCDELCETVYSYTFKNLQRKFLYPNVVIEDKFLYPYIVIEPLSKELLKKYSSI